MTGESQVEEPRTEAGRDMAETMERIVAGLAALATTPRRATRADIVVKVRAIEDQARAAALTAVEEAVAGIHHKDEVCLTCGAHDGGTHSKSHRYVEGGVSNRYCRCGLLWPCSARRNFLAAITALRQPQEAKDTRGVGGDE